MTLDDPVVLCTRCPDSHSGPPAPARHRIEVGGVDSGARVCCQCLNDVMVQLAVELVLTGHGQEAADGLASFVGAHLGECGERAIDNEWRSALDRLGIGRPS